MYDNAPPSKVFYRPIEASIRWAGLLRFKRAILAATADNNGFPVRHQPAYPTTSSFGSGNTSFTEENASLFSKKLRKCQGSTSR